MNSEIAVQFAVGRGGVPAANTLRRWALVALANRGREAAELTIRIVDRDEGAYLNEHYRGVRGATNVLAFPMEGSVQERTLLGDIVICAPVVSDEAEIQRKPPSNHWAHLVVHGVLHLLGYDHQTPEQAGEMEELERRILGNLGYPDPYATEE